MPKIDLYKVFQLDPRQSPEELAAQLDRQIAATDPANRQLRQQITTPEPFSVIRDGGLSMTGRWRTRARGSPPTTSTGSQVGRDDSHRPNGRWPLSRQSQRYS